MAQLTSNPFEVIEQRLENIECLIRELKNEKKLLNSNNEDVEEIGGIQLAEKVTGLAKPTIYALVSQSKMPVMKKAKKLYFSKKELIDWIKSGRRKTAIEKNDEINALLLKPKKTKKK
ncbi:helix-turn-helix domain-containing protein [Pedobacter sp.]|jgi:hypothetical protein|uniref:helix-turn-helix domain-containing protein n=1 Tax=Pedobacter sp. TaxID=1411316 RepID=UPI002CF3A4BE|nr:helix-turn-helix domain-containing protein [Pedobacter sp.]HWW41415.1 helix-turn-helix domain-containing protein [Pedobacter sp.]